MFENKISLILFTGWQIQVSIYCLDFYFEYCDWFPSVIQQQQQHAFRTLPLTLSLPPMSMPLCTLVWKQIWWAGMWNCSSILSKRETVDESSEQWKDGTVGGQEKGRLKGMGDARENRLPCLASTATSRTICHKVGGHDGGWRHLNSRGAAPTVSILSPSQRWGNIACTRSHQKSDHTKNIKALCPVLQIIISNHIAMKSFVSHDLSWCSGILDSNWSIAAFSDLIFPNIQCHSWELCMSYCNLKSSVYTNTTGAILRFTLNCNENHLRGQC